MQTLVIGPLLSTLLNPNTTTLVFLQTLVPTPQQS